MQRLCREWDRPSLFLVSIFPPGASHVIMNAWPKSASGYIRVPRTCPLTSELHLLILSPRCEVFQNNCILSVKDTKKNWSPSRADRPRWTPEESWEADPWGNKEWAWIVYLAQKAALGRTEIYLRMSGRVNRLYDVPGWGRFTSCIVYLGDNSRWRKYQESSAKSTGPGVWLPEFKVQPLQHLC